MNLFGVLKHFDLMIGCDFHTLWPMGAPAPGPPAPHYCTATLMNTGATALMNTSDYSHFGWSLKRGTDIGPAIAHVSPVPNSLSPLIFLASASKSEWGSQQYLVEGKPGAIALLCVVNPNLNCGDPVPLPLDGVIAVTSHFVGMTLGEFLAGALAMLEDMAIQGALNLLGSFLFDASISVGVREIAGLNLGQRIYSAALFKPMMYLLDHLGSSKAVAWLFEKDLVERMAKGFATQLPKIVGMDFAGAPTGYSFPPNGFGYLDNQGKTTPGDPDSPGYMERSYNATRDYFDGPGAEPHDVPPSGPDAGTSDAVSDAGDGGAAPYGADGGAPNMSGGDATDSGAPNMSGGDVTDPATAGVSDPSSGDATQNMTSEPNSTSGSNTSSPDGSDGTDGGQSDR